MSSGGGKKTTNPKQNADDKASTSGAAGRKDEHVSGEKRDSLKGNL
jgi:hypothetical protein